MATFISKLSIFFSFFEPNGKKNFNLRIIIKVIMKVKRLTIAIHTLVWLLLLVIPYISTDRCSIRWTRLLT